MTGYRWVTTVALALFTALSVPGAAAQSQPQTCEVEFCIYEDPADPESAIAFRIILRMHAASTSGSSIGWAVDEIEFRDPGSGGDDVWRAYDVAADTQDGLWWVNHHTPTEPQRAEFARPARFVGVAQSVDPWFDDLEFDFRGESYTPPLSGAPYDVTAALSFQFTAGNEARLPPGWWYPTRLPPREPVNP